MQKYALILVEGYTEMVFYRRIKDAFFSSASSKLINLFGNWDINTKILDEVTSHADAHRGTIFSVFICIDRESRDGKAPINLEMIKQELAAYENVDQKNIILYEAVQDIESWFFHDIEGIFKFLKMPTAKRNPKKYRPVEKFCHRDMSKLFKIVDKEYRKGNAAQNFINNLDLDLIKNGSQELASLCIAMQKY